jgi:hypothetical protein
MGGAPASDKNRGTEQPAIISTLSYVSLVHEAEPTLHLRFCPCLHLTSP